MNSRNWLHYGVRINKYYIKRSKKIDVLLNNASKGQTESEIPGEDYCHLRSAVELCAEYEIFQVTVKCYQKI